MFGVVPWVGRGEREGVGKRKKVRFESLGNINIIGGGRNAWSWKESDSWGRRGKGVFHPHRFHHHNATDPVPVSDIKWSRACKLSHSVAEAPILATTYLARPKTARANERNPDPHLSAEQQPLETGIYFFFVSPSPFSLESSFRFFDPKIANNFNFKLSLLESFGYFWISPPPLIF